MKGIAVRIHAIAVGFSVVLPAMVCAAEDYTRYYIHAIGDGTLVVNSCLLPERFAVRTERDTVVIRLDGEKGTLSDLKVGQWVKLTPRSDQDGSENLRITRIEVVAPPAKPVDEERATTAEVVVRGILAAAAADPKRGGWPTYTLTVSDVFKTPKDLTIAVGQKLTVKTTREFNSPVTLYLVFDKDQQLYRLQDPTSERGFSHVDAVGLLTFDTYSGYFVSNKFETNAAESFVVITDQTKFDQIFGVAFVMNDKSHRLPKDAFESLIVATVIKRGNAFWEYGVEDVTVDQGVIQLRYKASSRATPDTTFACPLIVSVPRDKYQAVVFSENGKNVKTVKLLPQARE